MSKLILMRHGESKWNQMNLFTGWVDIPLSEKGIKESIAAGKLISEIPIDLIVTTTLIRAQMSAMLAMSEHKSGKVPVILHPGEGKLDEWGKIFNSHTEEMVIPVIRCWELNERMYGELQGMNKAETIAKFGADQVQMWRRSYDTAPPGGESLSDTAQRAIPYFKEKIVPLIKQGLNVLISAHGNSLRSIIMHLDELSKEEVIKLEIGTGVPIIYDYVNGVFTKEMPL
jgi:2,3-bisphosphoglycerate-dependent phosphoglycerate mutase